MSILLKHLSSEVMDKEDETLKKHFSSYFTAYCLSVAILEDYSEVISRMEGCKAEDVKKRVRNRIRIPEF